MQQLEQGYKSETANWSKTAGENLAKNGFNSIAK